MDEGIKFLYLRVSHKILYFNYIFSKYKVLQNM